MKMRYLFYPLVAIVALGALAVACGDAKDGDEGEQTSTIRTEKGLAVAARAADLGLAPQLTGAGLQEAAPGRGGDAGFGAAPASDVVIERGLSPYLFPVFQQAQNGLTVQGFGSAAADADGAMLELYFGTRFQEIPVPAPLPEGRAAPGADGSVAIAAEEPAPPPSDFGFQEVEPITEEDLQPVIAAIVAAGVDRSDIEFVEQGYYDPYFASATLRVTIDDVALVDAVVDAARTASAGLEGIDLQSSNVLYRLSDCRGLEIAAMRAAVEDAGERVAAFAEALGAGVGAVVGAANYSYTPFDGTACTSGYGYYPLGLSEGRGPAQVEVFASIVVTYAIR
jgi:hypothetical protein